MGKPSIFSREYEMKMKRRRRRVFSLVFVLVIIIGIFTFRSNLNTYITKAKDGISSIFNKDNNETKEGQLATNKEEETNVSEDVSKEEENITEQQTIENEPEKEQAVEIKFSNGDVAKALYEGEGENKQYKLIPGLQNGNTADISPSGKSIIASDIVSQDLKLIDINGVESIATKTQYISKAGDVFNKDDIIKQYQGYIWASSPRFIDDSHIAYLSYLPYFKTGDIDTYVWILDTSNGNHSAIWSLKGKSISFGNLTENKLEVTVDEKKYLLMPNGSVSKL